MNINTLNTTGYSANPLNMQKNAGKKLGFGTKVSLGEKLAEHFFRHPQAGKIKETIAQMKSLPEKDCLQLELGHLGGPCGLFGGEGRHIELRYLAEGSKSCDIMKSYNVEPTLGKPPRSEKEMVKKLFDKNPVQAIKELLEEARNLAQKQMQESLDTAKTKQAQQAFKENATNFFS